MRLRKNEKGFATILAVVVTSLVLVTSLTSVYVYYVNNLRYQARIKEAYKMISVMEQAAKVVRSAWDEAAATRMQSHGGDISSLDSVTGLSEADITLYNAEVATTAQTTLNKFKSDPSTCAIKAVGTDQDPICVDLDDSDDATVPDPSCYCFATNNQSMQAFNWNLKLQENNSPLDDNSYVGKFIARLEKFYDRTPAMVLEKAKDFDSQNMIAQIPKPVFMGWALSESKALAGNGETGGHYPPNSPTPTPYPENTKRMQAMPSLDCSKHEDVAANSYNQCMKCGASTGVACVNLYGCPKSFGSLCENVSVVGAAGQTGYITSETAMFRQPFMVVPMGHGTRYK